MGSNIYFIITLDNLKYYCGKNAIKVDVLEHCGTFCDLCESYVSMFMFILFSKVSTLPHLLI